ncbi:MAG: aldehyde dehydrogenase family protein, partial [Gammaproteobacteria bacterium]
RHQEFAEDLSAQTGQSLSTSLAQVEKSIERLFESAAWADKFGGSVNQADFKGQVVTCYNPVGVIGMLLPEHDPLLGAVSMLAPALALGNTVVLCASESAPVSLLKLAQVIETSDVPAGTVNIVAGPRGPLGDTLAAHAGVHALWLADEADAIARLARSASSTLKRILALRADTDWGSLRDSLRLCRAAVAAQTVWHAADIN